jgi:hypothetical protein
VTTIIGVLGDGGERVAPMVGPIVNVDKVRDVIVIARAATWRTP